MINNNKLTILIPTYNRVNELEETINMFKNEINLFNLNNTIDLLVGDNASNDNTIDILKKNNVKYYTNQSNMGITTNILKGISLIQSKYIWIFGDDDIINKNLLPYIIDFLKNNEISSLWLPSKTFFDKQEINFLSKNNIYITEYNFWDKFDQTPESIELDIGFISSHIINTKDLKNILKKHNEDEVLKNNNYYNKLFMYEIFIKNKQLFVFNKPVVFKKISQGSHFSNDIQIINKTFIEDINYLYPKYNKLDKKLLNFSKQYNSKRYLLYFLIKVIHKDSKKILIKEYKIYKKIYILCLAYIPKTIIVELYKVYKKIKKTDYPLVLQTFFKGNN